MIRNSDINDPDNTEMHRDVWIIAVISYQFRIVSVIEGCGLLFRPSPDLLGAMLLPDFGPPPFPDLLSPW